MSTSRRAAGGARPRPRTRRERSAGGVVVRNLDRAPLFLLIRDSYGHWGFPKGHLERGERPEAAALREVREETGLADVRLLGAIGTIRWRFRFRGCVIHKRCHFYLMESASSATRPQKSEGITACKWVPAAEALDLIAYDNARGVLRQADELVARQPRERNDA